MEPFIATKDGLFCDKYKLLTWLAFNKRPRQQRWQGCLWYGFRASSSNARAPPVIAVVSFEQAFSYVYKHHSVSVTDPIKVALLQIENVF